MFVLIVLTLQTCKKTETDCYILYAGTHDIRRVAENGNISEYENAISSFKRVCSDYTDDGVVGYSCGMWHRYPQDERVNISFSYDEKRGIYHFDKWKGDVKIECDRTPTFEEFKQTVIEMFKIKKLYRS